MERLAAAIGLLAKSVGPLMQIARTIQTVDAMIARASAEGRDLNDDELAHVRAQLAAADEEWQAARRRQRLPAAEDDTQG